ncbi:chemotaxis protein CheW [Sphaerochaeta sp. S2]|uniref:chemotaxis protein CheW n=1 Tax=Sphaerochaeta sp. S2 TaxID=2798868 RepID=UPI0018E9A683|nr:chemotaxis protein CheW [Sphaerochaeta sp. S2]MBJ2355404.1 purine-binding chemotaxis protein CheW [Sphaerochaeta sp. S2]
MSEALLEINETQENKFLTFAIGDDNYGLEISYVDDIIGVQTITEIPCQPHHMKGVINLRGQIIPVVDARIRFNKPERNYDDRTCIVVVTVEEIPIGLIVDRVLEVVDIEEEHIAEPPHMETGGQKYMKGIGQLHEQIVMIIDCYKLFVESDSI